MLIKSQPDEIQSYLSDASYLKDGHADQVVFPKSAAEVSEIMTEATRTETPVTVSGAGTGSVAGRVPFGGIVLATDKLSHLKSLVKDDLGGSVVAEAGVVLADLQRFVESQGLFYPPDPTERGCFIGGNVATNASGARTFKYGPTRNYVERIRVVLATGDEVDLKRGALHADSSGRIRLPLSSGRAIEAQLPSYRMPHVRKHASGYFVAPGMDVIDLFIGSEGTLGVVTEAELRLLAKPEAIMSGIVFFHAADDVLNFVRSARELSLASRRSNGGKVGFPPLMEKALGVTVRGGPLEAPADDPLMSGIDARVLEYFDKESLSFLRQQYETIPAAAVGAIFFEQEIRAATEDSVMNAWLALLESHGALLVDSWFATNEKDQAKLREFRHALPVLMNEWFARYNQRKVSTDMSVPDDEFPALLRLYEETLAPSGLKYTIFGHIGDNHVHVNILPRNDVEATLAREIYLQFVKQAVKLGGTISAEHGIGKLKRDYLRELYGEEHLREMAALKRAFDPAGILGRGNIFSESMLLTTNF